MAKLSQRGEKFVLEMEEHEIRNLIGSLNSGFQGIPVRTAKRWATFLNAYKDSRMKRGILHGSPAKTSQENPFSEES